MYKFANAGGMRDKVEDAIVAKLQAVQYPAKVWFEKAEYKGIKRDGGKYEHKQRLIVIESEWGGKEVIVSCIAMGSDLYVDSTTLAVNKMSNPFAGKTRSDWFGEHYRGALDDVLQTLLGEVFKQLGLTALEK